MENSIKFYANWDTKTRRFYISGKNEKGQYFNLWKSKEFNDDLYLYTDMFKKGVEISKDVLKILPRDDGNPSSVLVFKTAEEEAKYSISKEEMEKAKEDRAKTPVSVEEYVNKLFKDLFKCNDMLSCGNDNILSHLINEETVTNTDDIPF